MSFENPKSESMFDIVSRKANQAGLPNLSQEDYNAILNESGLSDEEKQSLNSDLYSMQSQSPEEKQLRYGAETKILNAAMQVAQKKYK